MHTVHVCLAHVCRHSSVCNTCTDALVRLFSVQWHVSLSLPHPPPLSCDRRRCMRIILCVRMTWRKRPSAAVWRVTMRTRHHPRIRLGRPLEWVALVCTVSPTVSGAGCSITRMHHVSMCRCAFGSRYGSSRRVMIVTWGAVSRYRVHIPTSVDLTLPWYMYTSSTCNAHMNLCIPI